MCLLSSFVFIWIKMIRHKAGAKKCLILNTFSHYRLPTNVWVDAVAIVSGWWYVLCDVHCNFYGEYVEPLMLT